MHPYLVYRRESDVVKNYSEQPKKATAPVIDLPECRICLMVRSSWSSLARLSSWGHTFVPLR